MYVELAFRVSTARAAPSPGRLAAVACEGSPTTVCARHQDASNPMQWHCAQQVSVTKTLVASRVMCLLTLTTSYWRVTNDT